MSETVKLKISPVVATYVRPGAAREIRLAGIQAVPTLEPPDQVTLLFCLGRDHDPAVKEAAKASFAALPENILLSYSGYSDAHPALLTEVARVHGTNVRIAAVLLQATQLPSAARDYLQSLMPPPPEPVPEPPTPEPGPAEEDEIVSSIESDSDVSDECEDEETAASDFSHSGGSDAEYMEVDENAEEYLSKYKMIQIMGIGEKIKMSLTGDKEWRAILVKDANKLVSAGVLKNPRITEAEVLRIIKMGVQNDEVIRIICANREWIKNYQIRKALIDCPKTPLANSLRYLALLHEKDLASYAKSRNVSSVISTQAKRMILAKQKNR